MIDRFAAFVERKERDALRAIFLPFTTDVDAASPGYVAIGSPWTRARFDGDFYLAPEPGGIPATSLVFVQSRDGNTGARNPATLGGGETDAHLVYEGLSRAAADAVLAGAETVRGGDIVFSVWHPEIVALRTSLELPRHPIQIVATLRGLAFDETLLYNVPDLRVVVVTRSASEEFPASAAVRSRGRRRHVRTPGAHGLGSRPAYFGMILTSKSFGQNFPVTNNRSRCSS